ncbi:hypothetical protein CHGG_10510 [Chaetomium globosum CBS 148.51]|uniref:Ca2+-modulated nonselective cation channel polycystin n=1 Tax=Chaetomium globosum (strain ATCC 6205 / CBS 148.51 / DSM 1962 / NBRC 6347 / NRRL 1970) TaxID=306901 RepID=Q2GNE4_CHAGB|nr:uncharacterized protein CHGG_10510 [Chaetomium globosum CBS 148.51]EAQ84106.1 hypothetical protein CHGG_10510 [Chaetomium globosum CBS 148.51]
MAMAETAAQPHDQPGRLGRRRPFSALMKKLANLKATSSSDGGRHSNSKRHGTKKPLNNPYPQSGRIAIASSPHHSHYSVSSGPSRRLTSVTSLDRADSVQLSHDGQPPPTTGGRSMAPTYIEPNKGHAAPIIAPAHGDTSVAGTSRTANGRRGGDSTFSSPAPSVRSLTTTLTTIQTVAPATGNNNQTTTNQHSHNSNSQVIHFNQPFPTGSPASAIPAHLASGTTGASSPATYHTATANNLLTDNASILTLASSSKRRRRRSFDTDASVRALAPSSLWGGSRESLPLSVLSATMDGTVGGPTTPGLHRGASSGMGGIGANERTSIYSATGILGTTAASERNSFYAKQGYGSGDGASVRSGLFGHGRADSVAGSIGGGLAVPPSGTSPLASPREGVEEEKELEQEKVEAEKEKN